MYNPHNTYIILKTEAILKIDNNENNYKDKYNNSINTIYQMTTLQTKFNERLSK